MWRLVNPFEGSVALAAALVGFRGLMAQQQATGVLAELWPQWAVALYFLGLFLGGVAILCGMAMTLRHATRARIELWRVGLLSIAVAWSSYGLTLVLLSSSAGTAGIVLLVVGLAAAWRWWQLRARSKEVTE